MREKTLFIVNPSASGNRAHKVWLKHEKQARQLFSGKVDVAFTQRADHATEIAREAALTGYRSVISVGGDGTHNEVVNGLMDPQSKRAVDPEVIWGILPIGTGNDLARTIGLPLSFADALTKVAKAAPKATDIGSCTYQRGANNHHRFFANVYSFGLSGRVDEIVGQSSKWCGGKITFLKSVIQAVLTYMPQHTSVVVDGAPQACYDGLSTLVVVANGSSFGAGLKIAPQASLEDGKLDVVIVKGASRAALLSNLLSVYRGTHLKNPLVKFLQCETLVAQALPPAMVLVDIDGEPLGAIPTAVKCLPRALQMLR